MLRTIGGVVLGYLSMAVIIFLSFTIAFLVMGSERAFQPGSYNVSGIWLGLAVVVSFVAAVFGGIVCAKISRNGRAVLILAAIILALGLVVAIISSGNTSEGTTVRTGDVGNFDAMQNAREPDWYFWVIPFVGVGGLLTGSRLSGVKESSGRAKRAAAA